jgi:MerR family transcriptional regulator, light-induced transcriptional regulator
MQGTRPFLGWVVGTAMEHDGHEDQMQHHFLAELLRTTAGEIGVSAAHKLIESNPGLAARYQPLPACKWKDTLTSWTIELSAALTAGCPSIFARQIAWRRSAFIARGVPTDDLKLGLGALRTLVLAEVPEEDRATIDAFFKPALCAIDSTSEGCGQSESSSLCADTKMGQMGIKYLVAILEGDRFEASKLILEAAASGTPVHDLYTQVLCPAQTELGRMWEQAEIDVAEEHFATATTQMVMAQLYSFLDRRPRNGLTVVAATVTGNHHDIGIRMVADFFEMAGWKAVYLGQGVPPEELATSVVTFEADLLVLGACMHTQLQAIGDAVRMVRSLDEERRCKILVGGPGFAETGELWRTMGADAFAESAETAVAAAEQMMRAATPPTHPATPPADASLSPAPSQG